MEMVVEYIFWLHLTLYTVCHQKKTKQTKKPNKTPKPQSKNKTNKTK